MVERAHVAQGRSSMRTMRMMMVIAAICAGCTGPGGESAAAQAVAGPGGVTVTAPAAGELAVSWSADPAAFKFYVYQSAGGGSFAFVASVLDASAMPPAPTTYTATGLTGGVQYCFEVQSAYPDGTMSEIGAAGCGTATSAGEPAASAQRRRNVPLVLQWVDTTNTWAQVEVGVRSTSTVGVTRGGTTIDVPYEVGDSIAGIELWRFSDGTPNSKSAQLTLIAGSDEVVAAGTDTIASGATAQAMYSIPTAFAANHVMAAGERLRLILFSVTPGYTINGANVVFTRQ
ncbi:MAG TPA: hypothetical protein VHW23_45960 [Kofleriaceae bacterium]|jgi:hypothetical protein|nr:hypothetical protein [Kofleriaceae bacterium]